MARRTVKRQVDIPSVEEILSSDSLRAMSNGIPRPVVADNVRLVLARMKTSIRAGKSTFAKDQFYEQIESKLRKIKQDEITPVINATGTVVHTNLGRAPLSPRLIDDIKPVISGYSNLEFDLSSGSRGSRGEAAELYIAKLSGAESATVVNNCAAALFLILNTFALRREVVISRGELVQIGGGFRIPDILRRSGAKLAEVGTTNITTLKDYRDKMSSSVGLILKVHKSNFVQKGFSDEVTLKELVSLGKKSKTLVVNDLGSGTFVRTDSLLGHPEPTVQQSVSAGADLTCFSGDKLLGGVQAGLIVGKAQLIAELKANPLFRALRVDKIVFAVLERLAKSYLENTDGQGIALWDTLRISESELYKRAKHIESVVAAAEGVSVVGTRALLGGGALPQAELPSCAIRIAPPYKASALSAKLRMCTPPIIGRLEDKALYLDLKAVPPEHDAALIAALKLLLANTSNK